jgi:hypothetical protein
VLVDAKGKAASHGAQGRISKLQIKYPKLTKPATQTGAGQRATISFTLTAPDMDTLGFALAGITGEYCAEEYNAKSVRRYVQAALLLEGTSYAAQIMVDFKLSSKQDAGQISTHVTK